MAQMPATPKLRRARLLFTAALRGPDACPRQPGLAPSERAALTARADPAPLDPAEGVTFLIPLVGRHHVSDWDAVTDRLAGTVASLRAQGDGWQAVICGQDRPPLDWDARLHFLPFDKAVEGNDKWAKLAALYDHLPQIGPQAGYAMSFDADDLLRAGTVDTMLAGQAPGGYLAVSGYVRDMGTGATGLADAPSLANPLRKPFWKLCGSCAAVRYDLSRGAAEVDFLREMTQHEHRMFPYLARLAGRALTPLPDPSVMYLLNHGENFGARRGRVSFKRRFVERFRITDPDDLGAIARVFPAL